MEDRDCDNCIFHAAGQCRKWECGFISVKEAEEAVRRLRLEKENVNNEQ